MRLTAIAAAMLLSSALGASALDKNAVPEPRSSPVSAPSASRTANPAGTAAPPIAVPPHDYAGTAPEPADPQAGAPARKLYKRLRAQYGKRIFSGQTSDFFAEATALAGKTPVIKAYDMQNYSPRNPWNDEWTAWDDGSVKSAIDWHASTKGKGIVSFQWHWFSPSGGKLRSSTFYTADTVFDASKAAVAGTAEHAQVVRDIDAIAVQLKRLSDAGVPVLWRPLHEAAGGWFWWGARGPDACLKLYELMFDRLTNHHKLHNLIWVWSEPNPSWYPGNAKVDVVGYDSYPGAHVYAPQAATFDKLYRLVGGKKMVALTENGPIPDIDAAFAADVKWSFFLSWAKLLKEQNSAPHIKGTFAHPSVITLEK